MCSWSPQTRTDIWAPAVVVLTLMCGGLSACSSGDVVEEIVVPCTQEDSSPQITHWEAPVYPVEAVELELEGTVIVKVLVGIGGEPESAQVIQSVHHLLNDAAIQAAMDCQFVPGLVDCTIASSWVALPFLFRLQ